MATFGMTETRSLPKNGDLVKLNYQNVFQKKNKNN